MAETQMNAPKKRWPRWAKAFLAALQETGNHTQAAKAADIERYQAYDLRERDAEFAAAYKLALDEACDALEQEARRRAVQGVKRRKFCEGKPIINPETGEQYEEFEYSDTLLIFLLKGHRPERFRERYDINSNVKAEIEVAEVVVSTRQEAKEVLSSLGGPGQSAGEPSTD